MELHPEGFYKWNVFTLTRHLNWWRKTRRTGQKRPYDAAHIKKQYINTSDWTQEHTLSFLNQLTGMFFSALRGIADHSENCCRLPLRTEWEAVVFLHIAIVFTLMGCVFVSVCGSNAENWRRRGCECRPLECIQRPWSFLCARKQ